MTRINFSCAPPVTVEAEWDETVLDALLRSGTRVPFFCRSGICGQCKSLLASGEVMQTGTAPQILTGDELRQGLVLICRSIALTDCDIVPQVLPKDEGMPPWPEEVEVVQASWPTSGLFHFQVAAAPGTSAGTFLFHPGQYSHVRNAQHAAGDLPSRLYAATRPGHSFLDFYLMPRGERQVRVFDEAFSVGTRLQLARPVGASCLKEGEKGSAIIVADEEGLPAVLSMVELLRLGNRTGGLHVLVRGRSDSWLGRQLMAVCSQAATDPAFAAPGEMRDLLERTAQAVSVVPAAPGERPQAYVKGDESLVRLSRDVLFARGLRPWEVHAEILEGALPAL